MRRVRKTMEQMLCINKGARMSGLKLTVLVLCGLLFYRYWTTPRPYGQVAFMADYHGPPYCQLPMWDDWSLPEEGHSRRRSRVQEACEKLYPPNAICEPRLAYQNLYVDDSLRYMVCHVPTLPWTVGLSHLYGPKHGLPPEKLFSEAQSYGVVNQSLRPLAEYSERQAENKIRTYFKFMIVGHPMARLLKEYLDHFTDPTDVYIKYGRQILKRYRVNATKAEMEAGRTVTFSEFTRFVFDSNRDGTSIANWRPISELCQPCTVKYDLICRNETPVEDANDILQLVLSLDQEMGLHLLRSRAGEVTKQDAGIPQELLDKYTRELDELDKRDMLRLFIADFVMFGYGDYLPLHDLGAPDIIV